MRVNILNCFTVSAYIPAHLQTGGVVFLIETDRGLILVDTGPGEQDYLRKPFVMKSFQLVTRAPLDPDEAVVRQLKRRGFNPLDVSDIVLTHMHFDHCGGIPDFPHARIHVLRKELNAFHSPRIRWQDGAYVRRHTAHSPDFELYDAGLDAWFDFPAVRLRVEPEMYLIPLHGHSAGHCGVAMRLDSGWLFHAGDAAPASFDDSLPGWFVEMVLGPHVAALRTFRAVHPDIRVTTGHMLLNDPVFQTILQ